MKIQSPAVTGGQDSPDGIGDSVRINPNDRSDEDPAKSNDTNNHLNSPGNLMIEKQLIEFALLHAIRLPELFHPAQANLTPEHFPRASEVEYWAIWKGTLDYYGEMNELPPREQLASVAIGLLQSEPFCLPETIAKAEGIINWMYSVPMEELRTHPSTQNASSRSRGTACQTPHEPRTTGRRRVNGRLLRASPTCRRGCRT